MSKPDHYHTIDNENIPCNKEHPQKEHEKLQDGLDDKYINGEGSGCLPLILFFIIIILFY